MVKDENPFLVSETFNDYTVWRTSDNSPTYDNAVTEETINKDIDGQDRPTNSNPGADHFSLESVRYQPLQPADVGPNAYETDDASESLYLSAISGFEKIAGSQEVTVTANVDWVVTDDADWISVSPSSGTNNGSFNVIVTANSTFTERTGKVTINGGDLTRSLNVTQAAADPKDSFELINDQSVNDKVSALSAFHEEIDESKGKNNIKEHTLDKSFDTQWSGFGVPGEIIFDLGGSYDLALVDFATTSGKTYEFQIWVSNTDAESGSFVNAFTNDNLVSNSDGSFKGFILPTVAEGTKFVKVIGYGQPARPSDWNTIKEIEFYKTKPLSVNSVVLDDEITLYPNPTNNILNIKVGNRNIEKIQLYNVTGRKVLETKINNQNSDISVNVSQLAKGAYFVVISEHNSLKTSKSIIIK